MPLLKRAKKKLRQDKQRTEKNRKIKAVFKKFIKKAKEEKTLESVSAAFSSIDKAAKKNLLHKNKAARLKSALSKALVGSVGKKSEPKSENETKKIEKKKTTKVVKKAAPKKK